MLPVLLLRWSGAAGAVSVVDAPTGRILDRARVSDMGCGSVAFSLGGKYLVTPSMGGLITWPYHRRGIIRIFEALRRVGEQN